MWADIGEWFQSPGGARVLQTAIVPALAILVAGVLAALIARAAMRAALRRADRDQAATAVAGLVEAARAAADADGSRGDRRRAMRLRTEADVRVRMLPLKGAARAADFAADRTQRLLDGTAGPDAIAELRDALIAWAASPKRARKLFAGVEPAPAARALAERPAEPVREEPEPEPEVPAWRRTRSAERLQAQQTARAQAEEAGPDDTAPVRVPHSHRADPAPIVEVEQLERAEAHQAARRTPATPAAATVVSAPAAAASVAETAAVKPAVAAKEEAPSPRREGVPDWLDVYDDEAQVTQNMDLRTPPPVSATSVRDRAPAGDIVPRP